MLVVHGVVTVQVSLALQRNVNVTIVCSVIVDGDLHKLVKKPIERIARYIQACITQRITLVDMELALNVITHLLIHPK